MKTIKTKADALVSPQVSGVATVNNDGSVVLIPVENPNADVWFIIVDWASPIKVVITQDAESYYKLRDDTPWAQLSSIKEQFTAAERPAIKSAIKNYVRDL